METPSSSSGSLDAPTSNSEPASEKDQLMRDIKFTYSWSTDDIVMKANFKIENPTDHSFKDFEITCNHYAASGTKIDSNTRTIYEVVKAHGKKTVRDFNMGFINSQAKSSSCTITDLVPLD
jgi:hypothetical protein